MTRKNVYLVLALLGLVLPYWFFFQFLNTNGLNVALLIQQLFANDISTFFAVDLILSTIVFWIFTVGEASKYQMKNEWLYIFASLIVGLSFALPLFLYFRERRLEAR
ncbi:MAG TPA: DUF2834 domain-containing protein [Anaerolineales bacterium]|nr:DUF2834 domain-containing protein [Anaerolineales bacterium]